LPGYVLVCRKAFLDLALRKRIKDETIQITRSLQLDGDSRPFLSLDWGLAFVIEGFSHNGVIRGKRRNQAG